MAVDEHDELPKATQREAELETQIDDLQGQVTGLHRAREDINPELSLEFQIVKEKLDEHLSKWSRASRSSASSNRSILPSETRTKPLTQHATRSVDSGLRFAPCCLWKYLTLGHARISQLQRREEKHLRDKKAKNAQTYDGEDSDSEPKPDKEASDGAARAESPIIAHLHQIFSNKLDAMQSMVERLLGVAPPIRKRNPNSYPDTPFTDEIKLIEMPRNFSFPSIKAYNGTTDPNDHVAQFRQRMLAVALPKGSREATMCKGFGSTLTGPALQLYINLPSRSIASFAVLSDKFMEQFSNSGDLEKTSDSLYEILHHRAEPLRGYIARFNQEKVAIPKFNIPTAISASREAFAPTETSTKS
ncbi:uncharacterized protein LOC117133376 [Brassica rapa]|uniref:uncharacterized protein LOC117133376 n=1 Tax=Brassica campestris TaxID=3711 RepID=UPI00142E8A94|nr:uncharacterized protein LOC117133376 [Brassica rapa]